MRPTAPGGSAFLYVVSNRDLFPQRRRKITEPRGPAADVFLFFFLGGEAFFVQCTGQFCNAERPPRAIDSAIF